MSENFHIDIWYVSSSSEVGTLELKNDFQIYHWTIKFKLFLKSLMAWALELTKISILLVIIADSLTLNKVLMWLRPVFNATWMYRVYSSEKLLWKHLKVVTRSNSQRCFDLRSFSPSFWNGWYQNACNQTQTRTDWYLCKVSQLRGWTFLLSMILMIS